MSLRLTGPVTLATATNSLMSAQVAFTVALRVRLAASSATPASLKIWRGNFDQKFTVALGATLNGAAYVGGTYNWSTSYSPGVVYHVVVTYDGATITTYVNGIRVNSATRSGASSTSTQPLQIGINSAAGVDYTIGDYLILDTGVSESDVLADRDGTTSLRAAYPDAIVRYWGFTGTTDAQVQTSDDGLKGADATGSLGLPYGTINGTGTRGTDWDLTWSDDTLAYVAPVEYATAKILPGGALLYVSASLVSDGSRATASAIDATRMPTLRRADGSTVSLGTPTIGDGKDWQFRGVVVPILGTPFAEGETGTIELPEGFLTTTDGRPEAVTLDLTNLVGGDLAAWPEPTMRLGINLSQIGANYPNELTRNLLRQRFGWTGVSAYGDDGLPSSLSASSAYTGFHSKSLTNYLDSLQGYGTTRVEWYTNANPDCYVIRHNCPEGVNPRIRTSTGNLTSGYATITERTDLDKTADGYTYQYYQVAFADEPTTCALNLRLYIDAPITGYDLRVIGPGNDPESDNEANEVLVNSYKGASVVRLMDTQRVNNSRTQDVSEMRDESDPLWWGETTRSVSVAYIDPVPDDDVELVNGHGGSQYTAAKITTSTPHGWYARQNATFNAAPYNETYTNASGAHGTLKTAIDGVFCGLSNKQAHIVKIYDDYSFCAALYTSDLGSTKYANSDSQRQYFDATRTNLSTFWASPPIGGLTRIACGMDADPWVCVPFPATNAYVEAMARRVFDNLDTGRKVWVEYSNEIWNEGPAFAGQNLGAIFAANLDGMGSIGFAGIKWGFKRAAEIHAIFAAVAAEYGRPNDLVRVLAYWYNGYGNVANLLQWCQDNSIVFDAWAIAPYIDVTKDLRDTIQDWTTSQIGDFWELAFVDTFPQLSDGSDNWLARHKAALQTYYPSAQLVTYESSLQAFMKADADDSLARARDFMVSEGIYRTKRRMFANMQAAGCDVDVPFCSTNTFYWQSSKYYPWMQTTWHGQPPGIGTNYVSAIDKPADVHHDGSNVAPQLYAWLEWAGALPDEPPPVEPPEDTPFRPRGGSRYVIRRPPVPRLVF